jgi:hypothetical protein
MAIPVGTNYIVLGLRSITRDDVGKHLGRLFNCLSLDFTLWQEIYAKSAGFSTPSIELVIIFVGPVKETSS